MSTWLPVATWILCFPRGRRRDQTAVTMNDRLAIFVATSGHSGVDRVIKNLLQQLADWAQPVDLLRVRRHGPRIEEIPGAVRPIDLGAAHVNTSLPALVRYLRRERPAALLTDKDRVNRIAILARGIARVETLLAVRLGTTVSVNLASRSAFERWQQRTSIRRLYPLADCVVVPSQGAAEDLAAYTGLRRDQVRVIPSPIVTRDLRHRAAEPLDHPWLSDGGRPVIVAVGELGYRKDFETLIRAFALVRRRRPCRLVILGRGGLRARLLGLGAKLGVREDLDLPGFLPNPYAFMARAELFVLSSRWEGMPVALVEALACHTPVVSTDCPSGPREVLGEHPVGALVPVGDYRAMADAIDAWLGAQVTEDLFERAIADYRIEASACAYLQAVGMRCPEALRRTSG